MSADESNSRPLDSTQNPKPTAQNFIQVSAGLIFRDGKLLITKRHPHVHLGGLWEFPGGKREPGESAESCLHRELREELGIEVILLERVETLLHEYPGKVVELTFFHCRWAKNEPQTLGCAEIAWAEVATLENFSFPAADMKLLARLKSQQNWWQ